MAFGGPARTGSKALPARERGAETRRRLVEAAMELWADRGSRGTGIAEVADRAGIGHPGLLHHFRTKDNLRLAVVRERDHQDLRRFETLFEPGGLDAIRALPEVAHAAEERPGLAKLYLVMVMENLDPGGAVHDWFVDRLRSARRLLAEKLALGVRSGEIRPDVDCELIAARIVAFMDGAEIQRLLDPDSSDLLAMYDDFTNALLRELEEK